MAGIKELSDVVIFGAALGNGIGVSYSDKEISWTDLTNLVPALIELPAAVQGIDQVVEELKDLDEAERAELLQLVKDRLDLPQDPTEDFIEDTVELVMAVFAYAQTHFGVLANSPADDDGKLVDNAAK